MSSGYNGHSRQHRLASSVLSSPHTTEPVGISAVSTFSSSKNYGGRQSNQSRLPQINPTNVINTDRRAVRKIKNELNLNPSRVLPDIKNRAARATIRTKNESSKTFNHRTTVLPDTCIKSHTKAATTSWRTTCHQPIYDRNSAQDEPEQGNPQSLAETTKKYQKNKVYGTSSWRQDAKSARQRETTKSATRGIKRNAKSCKEKNSKKGGILSKRIKTYIQALSDTEEERESRAQSSLDPILEQLEFDGDVIYRSDTQLGEAGSEYDPVIDTPRPTSPVDYSFKTLLSLDPNRKVPSRIPMLTGDLSKLFPPPAPVYPHPLRYFAGELIEKEYQKVDMLHKLTPQAGAKNNACKELSPRRPLDAFEQTMLELKRPSSAYSQLSFKRKQPDRASAENKLKRDLHEIPEKHPKTSRPMATTKIHTSNANWWIKELDIFRQTRDDLHNEVPGCTSTVSCSGDLQMTSYVDTTNAKQRAETDEPGRRSIMRGTPSSDTDGSGSTETNNHSRLSNTLPKYIVSSGYYRNDTVHPHTSSGEESDLMVFDHCLIKSPQSETHAPDRYQTCSVKRNRVPQPPKQSRDNSTNMTPKGASDLVGTNLPQDTWF